MQTRSFQQRFLDADKCVANDMGTKHVAFLWENMIPVAATMTSCFSGMQSPCFLCDSNYTVRKCRTLTPALKNLDSDFGLRALHQTPTLELIVCHSDYVHKDDFGEILNSSNKRHTVVYKKSFNCKINCTKVKQTATMHLYR